jgi:hypothetical protein
MKYLQYPIENMPKNIPFYEHITNLKGFLKNKITHLLLRRYQGRHHEPCNFTLSVVQKRSQGNPNPYNVMILSRCTTYRIGDIWRSRRPFDGAEGHLGVKKDI